MCVLGLEDGVSFDFQRKARQACALIGPERAATPASRPAYAECRSFRVVHQLTCPGQKCAGGTCRFKSRAALPWGHSPRPRSRCGPNAARWARGAKYSADIHTWACGRKAGSAMPRTLPLTCGRARQPAVTGWCHRGPARPVVRRPTIWGSPAGKPTGASEAVGQPRRGPGAAQCAAGGL